MAQTLLTSNGAQSSKPSKYKPIWTDRFFTGLFTNRSPFRSPLSTLYADGYNLGKSDTLLDGVNVEMTPRLTMARRPGQVPFSSAASAVANTFYSFHKPNGDIMIVSDTATSVNTVTSSAITSIYTKPTTSVQSNFLALGPNLYWGDGTKCQTYETETGIQRKMGIDAPTLALVGAPILGRTATPLTGTSYVLSGITFGAGGSVTTTNLLPNYSKWSMECWATAAQGPLVSFESSQTGISASVFYDLFINPTLGLLMTVRDATGTNVSVDSGYTFPDALLHHICVSFSFTTSIGNIISTQNGSVQNINPDASLASNFTYINSPTLSSEAAPTLASVKFYVDGVLVGDVNPTITSLATGSGYWRIGQSTLTVGSFTGFLSMVSITDIETPSPADHFTILNIQDSGNPVLNNTFYIDRINHSRYRYFWQFQEPSGTVATDSIGGNTGTYHTANLIQTRGMIYKQYGSTVAFAVDQIIIDPNGNLQQVVIAGTSGGSPPTWMTKNQQETTDGSVTWTCLGPAALDASTSPYLYSYSFINAQGHYSSLSPASKPIGFANAQAPNILGKSSPDPQVTRIGIFRTVAGGSTPFLVAIIPAPGAMIPFWNYLDNNPDGNLNILLSGPQANSNNPPPYGLNNLVFHMGRTWGAVANLIYCSGGPDTIVGNGNEAWPPANSWSYPAPVIRIIPNSQGLIVVTTSGIYIHAGGPSIAQFYAQPLFPRIGVSTWNAIDVKGNEVVLFTNDRQLLSVDLASNTLADLGYPILDKLAKLDPTKVYVVRHHNGLDNAVYLGTGTGGWYRCVPQQAPDYSITGPVWSPFAAIQFPS